MQFKTFTARRITLKKATNSDLEEYKQQVKRYRTNTDTFNLLKEFFYIKVEKENGKMIGLIQVNQIDNFTASIKASFPNNLWETSYGTEAIHQFIKCCKMRKLYRRIYFATNNLITKKYMIERTNEIKKQMWIDIYTD